MNSKFILSALVSLACLTGPFAFAGEGTNSGGGGDPVAAEFTFTMLKIGNYLSQNSETLPEVDRSKVAGLLMVLKKSLDSKSIIEVSEARPKDPHGVEKAAVFSSTPLRITVHRKSWEESNPREQVALAGMELLGLTGIKEDRYWKALAQFGDHADAIMSSSRKDEMLRSFVRLANDPKTLVGKKIAQTRALINRSVTACGAGSLPSIPRTLKMSELEVLTKSSDVYPGKFIGDETQPEWEQGYETWNFTISVPTSMCAYGGHFASHEGLEFSCSYEGKLFGSTALKNISVSCRSLNSVNPK